MTGQSPPPGDPGAARTEPARTHPLTPLIRAVSTLSVLAVTIVILGTDALRQVADQFGLGLALLSGLVAVVVLLLVSLGLHWLSWSRTTYYFDESGDFHLDSGVLSRQQRRVALSRLQSVDVTRPLLGRVFGMAAVRVEVAGGHDSRVDVAYLTEAQAGQLRAGIIARAAGVRHDAGEAPEVVLANVPTGDLIVSLLLRSETILLALLTFLVVGTALWTEGAAGLVVVLLTGGVPLLAVAGQFTRFFNFTVADSPDGLRLRFGLLRTEAQTVPPGRVQAVELIEPLLWRRRGWVRVRLNVAGVQHGQDGEGAERVLLPVAPHETARQIIARVLPGLTFAGDVPDAAALVSAPTAARRRAWLQFPNLAAGAGERVFVTRRGFLTRRTAVIPHARTQSVRVTQGPWQRALGLASVHVDSTPGPVRVTGLHLDARTARAMAEEQLIRAAAARTAGPPERWLARAEPPDTSTTDTAEVFAPTPDVGDDDGHEQARSIPAPDRADPGS